VLLLLRIRPTSSPNHHALRCKRGEGGAPPLLPSAIAWSLLVTCTAAGARGGARPWGTVRCRAQCHTPSRDGTGPAASAATAAHAHAPAAAVPNLPPVAAAEPLWTSALAGGRQPAYLNLSPSTTLRAAPTTHQSGTITPRRVIAPTSLEKSRELQVPAPEEASALPPHDFT